MEVLLSGVLGAIAILLSLFYQCAGEPVFNTRESFLN